MPEVFRRFQAFPQATHARIADHRNPKVLIFGRGKMTNDAMNYRQKKFCNKFRNDANILQKILVRKYSVVYTYKVSKDLSSWGK
jgi:hypothetical protein